MTVKMKKVILGLAIMSAVLLFSAQLPANASTVTFDAGKQFFSNPNGVWSYGWESSRGGVFNLFTNYLRNESTAQTDHWYSSQIGGEPCISYNGTGAVCHPAATTSFRPGKLVLHPGPNGEYCVLRWTAPVSGRFTLSVTFTGVSGYNGAPATTTDVAVFQNGTQLYLDYLNLNGSGNSVGCTRTLTVNSGESVDFIVGRGNGNYTYDSTEVDVSISAL